MGHYASRAFSNANDPEKITLGFKKEGSAFGT